MFRIPEDARDGMHGVYGLFEIVDVSNEMLSFISANYRKTTAQVFTDVAISALRAASRLEFLRKLPESAARGLTVLGSRLVIFTQ